MADLKVLYTKLGFTNILTYIQSGNVIFESDKKASEIVILIQETIKQNYDFEVPVIIRTAKEIEDIDSLVDGIFE